VKLLGVQVRAELAATLRNGEQLLLTLVIPVLLLVFFSLVDILPSGDEAAVDFLVPGILALAVMSTAMVSLGIKTGFERSYLVLKRLAVTPLGRGRLVGAKIVTVAIVEVVQVAVLLPVALALGWDPDTARSLLVVPAVAAGTVAFAGLGLLIAGRLRAELNLAVQNGLYLVLLLTGGIVFPLDELPDVAADIAGFLPSAALADVLRDAMGGAAVDPTQSWIVLVAWAVAMPLAAARTFRWW
jgi:ABC-2 type transport system permease protein